MRWPWSKLEARDSSFTDTLIQTIVAQASGATLAKPAATGALEASASIVARCFAAADVAGPDQFVAALGPSTLSMIGRALIRQGEILFRNRDPNEWPGCAATGGELGRHRRA